MGKNFYRGLSLTHFWGSTLSKTWWDYMPHQIYVPPKF